MNSVHTIVIGNEKGGSGKSTTAVHLAISLLKEGHRVYCLDLDARQRSLSRYFENRQAFNERHGLRLPLPVWDVLSPSDADSREMQQRENAARLDAAMRKSAEGRNVLIVDCPGSHTHLSELAHARADTLITPINDSFVDLDLIARTDPDMRQVTGLSPYAEHVWESRKRKAARGDGTIDWIVMRNRLSHLNARNKQRMDQVLQQLSKRIGFRLLPGFGERVIYRELFPQGLTLVDYDTLKARTGLSMSHLAARQELRTLVRALRFGEKARTGADNQSPALKPTGTEGS